MKLLIYSHFFAPSIGGVESAVLSLAGGLPELRIPNGDPEFEVTLVTHTPAGDFDDRSQNTFPRRPRSYSVLCAVRPLSRRVLHRDSFPRAPNPRSNATPSLWP